MSVSRNSLQSSKVYHISEIFYSLQGEGLHTGTPAIFIRMAGCNLKCVWCDTDHQPRHHVTKRQVVAAVKRVLDKEGVFQIPLIVITGGEPMLQYDIELHTALKAANRAKTIAVETNGTFDISSEMDDLFVTLSPKVSATLFISPSRPNEIKVVLADNETLLLGLAAGRFGHSVPKFVQPCWYPDDEAATRKSTQAAIEFVRRHPEWRLSLQTQKLARFA